MKLRKSAILSTFSIERKGRVVISKRLNDKSVEFKVLR
jgi:hypothetical protein